VGFGIGVPGFRISTRGVRVGPRIANVGIGRGGLRASAGPRIANVSVGRGGVRVGSGVGPLFVSNRGVGVSAGGLRVSNRGVGASVSPGPFWFGAGTRWPSFSSLSHPGAWASYARSTKQRIIGGNGSLGAVTHQPSTPPAQPRNFSRLNTRPGQIFGAPLANMGKQFLQYQNNLISSGVKRRNKYEIRSAAAQALLFGSAAHVSVLRSYSELTVPPIPSVPNAKEIRREARRRVRERGDIPLWSFRNSPVLDAECAQVQSEITTRHRVLAQTLSVNLAKVKNLSNSSTSNVMNTLFADNLFPARWIGCSHGHGIVVVAFGGVDEMIWPEEMTITKSGGVGVKKVSKDDRGRRHRQILVSALLSTAKEALSAQPNLARITVVAIDDFEGQPIMSRNVWGFTTIERRDLTRISTSVDLIQNVISLENQFYSADAINDDSEYSFFAQLKTTTDALDAEANRVAAHFMKHVFVRPTSRGTWLEPLGSIQSVFCSEPGLLGIFQSTQIGPAPTPDDALLLGELDYWLSLN
jgi:hypothetical protein